MTFEIRTGTAHDALAINNIANWYIENTVVNFDYDPWSLEKRLEWLEQFNRDDSPYHLLVGVDDDEVIGFTCNTRFKPKRAYDSSTEATVYIANGIPSNGRGGRLYQSLMDQIMVEPGLRRVYAYIALPNDPSIRLHERLGFTLVGIMQGVGTKFGRLHDCSLYQLVL